jgi:hypothetical protein
LADAIKFGPLWSRTVFDPDAKVIKYRMRTVARWDEVKRVRVREIITRLEEEQLLNLHPEVQKDRRPAELWLDLKDGRSVRAGEAEGAGLLLAAISDAARQMGVPIEAERTLVAEAETRQAAPKST